MAAFQGDPATGLWAEQPVGSRLDYTLDYTDALDPGDTIATSTWDTDDGIELSDSTFDDAKTSIWVSGGTAGTWYAVRNTVTTAQGRTIVQGFRLRVTDPTQIGAGKRSIFGDLAAAVLEIRRDRLVSVAQTYLPDVKIHDDYLVERILTAERHLEHALRIFLTPHEIRPEGTPQQELDALAAAGEDVVIEPGYDYDPEMFRGDSWGLIELRQRPVIAIRRLVFAYPSVNDRVWDVPLSWVRADRKYGRINLVPVQGTVTLPLNAWMLSVVGGGRLVPLMLQVSYRAGLDPASPEVQEIKDLVKRMVVRDLIEDQFLPASSSASADGLSESINFDPAKHNEAIEERIAELRDSFSGIRVMVF